MKRFGSSDQSRPVALWLFGCAAMVFAMVVIGGITRLTGSGLSITEWKPIMGALPPLNAADWAEAFEKYKAIPQYTQVNAGMSMADFQSIFWWEWFHRLFGRLIGVAFALPFFAFLLFRLLPERSLFGRMAMPTRLIWRCAVLLGLGGLQGLIGWWMVSSGLSERVDVAPERLTVHLGLALLIFAGLIWTGLEAWSGEEQARSPAGWSRGAAVLLGAVFVQCLLGGLVAGSKAGFIYTDWPLMNGAILAPVDWGAGGLAFLHDRALVQFNHRIWGYALVLGGTVYAVQARRWKLAEGLGAAAILVAGALWLQAAMGVVTLVNVVPLWLGGLHQAGAAVVLALATANLWRVRRSQARLFMSGPRRSGLLSPCTPAKAGVQFTVQAGRDFGPRPLVSELSLPSGPRPSPGCTVKGGAGRLNPALIHAVFYYRISFVIVIQETSALSSPNTRLTRAPPSSTDPPSLAPDRPGRTLLCPEPTSC